MRVPGEVLDRVRGVVVLAALATACGTDARPTVPAPEPEAVTATAPEPVDPIAYASADEAARLERLDAENATSAEVRDRRIDRLSATRRARLGGLGISGGGGPNRLLAMCGRG